VQAPAQPPLDSLFRLDGKRALVVGGYGGIGELLSQAFVEFGAAVAVAGRSQEKADELAGRLEAAGGRAFGVRLDASDRESVDHGVTDAIERLGGLDVLVNCASLLAEAKAEEFPEATWRQIIDVNLTGAFLLSQAAGRTMLEAGGGGRIIHFSSTRGAAGGRRGFAAYSASKGGLNMLVKQLATEWGRAGITVNAVAPGFVSTEFVHGSAGDERFTAMLQNRIPMGRFGEPFEMVGATVYLASPAATFVTGQVIFVDGGVTASS
jgi:gluconate 5-dehydrogenase